MALTVPGDGFPGRRIDKFKDATKRTEPLHFSIAYISFSEAISKRETPSPRLEYSIVYAMKPWG